MGSARLVLLCVAGIGLAFTGRAQAPAPVPDAAAFTFFGNNNGSGSSPDTGFFGFQTGSDTFQTVPTGSGAIYVTGGATAGPNPSVSNTVIQTVFQDIGAQSGSSGTDMAYSFEVAGPSIVPVQVDILGSVTDAWSDNLSTGSMQAVATLDVYDPDNADVASWDLEGQGGSGGGQTLSFDQPIDLFTNTVYTVILSSTSDIQLFAGDTPVQDGTYSVATNVDPLISIDRTFQHGGYALVLSSNLQPVPDAAGSLGLTLIAVAGLCVMARMRTAPARAR